MKGYNQKEREILEYVQQNHSMTTAEAMELTGASQSTIRRIFIKLQNDGMVERVFGGVKEIQKVESYHYHETVITNVDQKREIGELAARMVNSNEFIYIDCGTTTKEMCIALAKRIKNGEVQNLIVVTNSVLNLDILAPYCEIIIVGGAYAYDRKDVSGDLSELFLEQFRFHKSFLGTDGFSFDQGFTSTSTAVSQLGNKVSRRSEMSLVLMDASKIGRVAVGITLNLGNVDGIITDSSISKGDRMRFAEHHMKVFIKKEKGEDSDSYHS